MPQQEEQKSADVGQDKQVDTQEIHQDKFEQPISEEVNNEGVDDQNNDETDELLNSVAGESTTTADDVQEIDEWSVEPEAKTNNDKQSQDDEDSATAGFITLVVIGGGGYYLYKRIKRKSNK